MLSLLITVVVMSTISCIGGWYLGAYCQRNAEHRQDEEYRRSHRHILKSEYPTRPESSPRQVSLENRPSPDELQKIDEVVSANKHFFELILEEFKVLSATLKASFAEMEEARRLRTRIMESAILAHGQLDTVFRDQVSAGYTNELIQRFNAILDRIAHQSVRVRSIAAEVNVLAVNAGLEAARIGESGRGFTIFAECISKLSGSSTEAVMQIYEMIEKIREDLQPLLERAEQSPADAKAERESVLSGFSQLESELARLDQMTARSASNLASGSQSVQEIEFKVQALADTLANGLTGILDDARANSLAAESSESESASAG